MRRKTLRPNNPTPTKALVPTLKSEREGRQGAREGRQGARGNEQNAARSKKYQKQLLTVCHVLPSARTIQLRGRIGKHTDSGA